MTKVIPPLLVFSLFLFNTGTVDGAGIAIMEQSVKGLGKAFAGGAAAAEDASTIFYNPAGLVLIPGAQAIAGTHLVLPSAEFTNQDSRHVTGQPLIGGNGGNAGTPILIPNLYFSSAVNERMALGLGVNSPFGLSTEYDPNWVGRYHAIKSDLLTVNINPSVAFRITDSLSIGVGFNAQYLKTELTNAVDFGTIFSGLGVPGFAPQSNDGYVKFKGDSWGYGYNLGLLYEFSKNTRVGAAYRSSIDHAIEGDATFYAVPSPNPTGRFINSGLRSDITLPESMSLSVWHSFSKQLAIMADITWTNWGSIDELRIRFNNPVESDAVTTVKWGDAWRFSLGAEYTAGDWAFRIGGAYDQTPVPDAAFGTPRVPDNDRIWLTAGASYKISDNISIDTGYAHLFVKDTEIRKTATGENRFLGALSGSYKSSVDIISADLQWRF